jgi:MFS family permease
VIGIGIATLALVREPAIPASAPLRGLRYSFTLDIRRHHRFASAVAARFLFLLGTFGIGRLLYVFIQQELGLSDSAAPEAVGSILAAFALVTGCIALAGGWLADRSGRLAPMAGGAALGAAGALVLVTGGAPGIASGGLLMSAGSGLFAAGNWAVTSDLVPREEAARFMGIANFGTVGAAAAAGGAGLLVAFGDRLASGLGYPLLFVTASTAMALSLPFSVRACRSAPTTHTMLWPLRRA